MPTNVDIEYVGNSGQYAHLIGKNGVTKETLNYNMNLRSYKPTSQFVAEQPWQYPCTREFSPKAQYKDTNAVLSARSPDA